MKGEPTFLGTVQDVRGTLVRISLDVATISGISIIGGNAYRIGQVGSFVRIPVGYGNLIGMVNQVGAGAAPESVTIDSPFGTRWLSVQLLGELEPGGAFERGISTYPTIGDEAHLVTERDLQALYGRSGLGVVRIGRVASAESIPALLDCNRFVNRHAAVVGSTGSGKSTTVASILRRLALNRTAPSARILLLDLHGEYAGALHDVATVYRINSEQRAGERELEIPYWALSSEELLELTFGVLDEQVRGPVLEHITRLKRDAFRPSASLSLNLDSITADTPLPFSIHKLWFELHRLVHATHTAQGNGQSSATEALELAPNGAPLQPGDPMAVIAPRYRPYTQASGGEKIYQSSSPLNIRRQLDRLAARLRDPRYDFLFRPGPYLPALEGQVSSDLDSLLANWLGGSTVTLLDLSGVPSDVLEMIVGALLRIVYDALFWGRRRSEGAVERPLLVVMEEAHRYLSSDRSSFATQSVRRIVKEGRKYGIGALLVSQRPAEIDPTILSQCGTLVALRLSNSNDRATVGAAAGDAFDDLLATLPLLRTGEALLLGEAVKLPMRVRVDAPPPGYRPDSHDPLAFNETEPGGWNSVRRVEDYRATLHAWRALATFTAQGGIGMDRIQVDSSNLDTVAYDPSSNTLEISFKSGSTYQFYDVPQHVVDALLGAPSKGSYFNEAIKNGGYRYTRL